MAKKESDNTYINEDITSFISLEHVNKIYANGVKAVHDFNLDIEKNEFVALVGPSGCGKSTTLRMIAGLEDISSGNLWIDRHYANYLPSKDRDIAMVFQSYALYPNKNVYDNISFGLKIRHVPKAEIEERVFKTAEILDLGHLLDRFPRELSGGQMQRVALGRAIVRQANIFLMDEPLSNLDAKLRVQMRSEIVRIHREVKATTIYVTHDQTEAMTMATKIVVMNKGFVQQIAKPMEAYLNPNNLFVATFIGSPSMNIFEGTYANGTITLSNGISFKIDVGIHDEFYKKRIKELDLILSDFTKFGEEEMRRIESNQPYIKGEKVTRVEKKKKFQWLIDLINKKKNEEEKNKLREEMKEKIESFRKNANDALFNPHTIYVGIRPEHFYFEFDFRGRKKSNSFDIDIKMIELLGSEYIIHSKIKDKELQIKLNGLLNVKENEQVRVCFDEDMVKLFDVDSGMSLGGNINE